MKAKKKDSFVFLMMEDLKLRDRSWSGKRTDGRGNNVSTSQRLEMMDITYRLN